jgi:hypothetical protein
MATAAVNRHIATQKNLPVFATGDFWHVSAIALRTVKSILFEG